ncbi:MAG: hypothetical protein O8C63_06635 [Candidatus Methanoperedens sp.]|nr:hypothetical protein [Candidatus Methanoperedens sp.]
MLEKDTNDLGTTIHFDQKNFNTFGLRVYNLFFLACNLFENAAKEIERNPNSDMGDWKKNPTISGLSETVLTFKPTGYKFKPLKGLGYRFVRYRTLTWWNDYNSTKHELSLHKATLQNLIFALGSAGILVEIIAFPGGITGSNPSILFGNVYIPEI